ncbi:MAG: beta-lactamase family protein [Colwellia sp.]|nr:beta-lactamase family protein [Colwellia sp.]
MLSAPFKLIALSAMLFIVNTIPTFAKNVTSEKDQLTKQQTNLLDGKIDKVLKQYGIVGQSIALLHKGQLIYRKSNGFKDLENETKVDNNTVYSIYSVTKLFVVTSVLDLVDKNKIELDQTIGHYLKDIPQAWQSLTVRQLLSHTSGLPEYFSIEIELPENQDDVINQMANQPFQFIPGSRSRYIQTGFLLIKKLIEQKTNQPFVSAINDLIVKPLKLKHTSFGGGDVDIADRTNHYYTLEKGKFIDRGIHPFPRYTFAGSGLNSNIQDMTVWFNALISGEIISKATLFESWKPIHYTNGNVGRYANGWQYSNDGRITTIGHLGGDDVNLRHIFFNSDPENSVTVIHLTNGRSKPLFNMLEFSVSLANIVLPGLQEKAFALKENMAQLIANDKIDQAIDIYHSFKQSPSTRNINTEVVINNLGYEVMYKRGNSSETIELFKLNTLAYPKSANLYDSLAEAYLNNKNDKLAIKYYSKAFEMDSSLEYIPAILKRISSREK